MGLLLPALLILRLDYTLWPHATDFQIKFPCKRIKNGSIVDGNENIIECYPEALTVFENLKEYKDMKIAIIEDVEFKNINSTINLISLFGWDKYLSLVEIGPQSKTDYFKNLHEKTNIPFDEMLIFFNRNIYFDIKPTYIKKGLFVKHADDDFGIKMATLNETLKEYDLKKREIKPKKKKSKVTKIVTMNYDITRILDR